jgi:beta-galactosidase
MKWEKIASLEESSIAIPAGGSTTATLVGSVEKPRLWDIATPNRYLARTVVSVGGKEVDAYDTPFGFRTLEFTARDGFKLNGKRVEVYGTCNHHDLGAVSAENLRAHLAADEILKRWCATPAHVAQSPIPGLLDLSYRMIILVQDEAFRLLKRGKGERLQSFFEAWHVKNCKSMLRRDRNHRAVQVEIGMKSPNRKC